MRKMLLLAAAIVAFGSPMAHGQTTSTDPWLRVEQLKPGTTLRIKTTRGKVTCGFMTADAESVTCSKGITVHLQKTEIRSITISHRLRSALAGLAIGGAGGGLGGYAAEAGSDKLSKQAVSGVFGVGLAFVGGIAGAATDFTRSTVYKQ